MIPEPQMLATSFCRSPKFQSRKIEKKVSLKRAAQMDHYLFKNYALKAFSSEYMTT